MMTARRKGKTLQDISVGNIKNDSGTINIAGGNISITTTTNGSSIDKIAQVFESIYARIEMNQNASAIDKADLKNDVQDVQTAIMEPKVDESFVSRRLRNIGRMAPDILDVILATITSPAAGLGMVGKKIAEKVKEK